MITSPQTLFLLGIRIHALSRDQLLQAIVDSALANTGRKTIIAHVNVHAMNLAYKLPWYREFLNQADLVFCDGFGVALGAKLTGQFIKAEHRTTCPDWIESLGKLCQQQGLSLFLLAGQPGVAEAAAAKLQRVAPGLRVAYHHGYFQKTGLENEQVIAQINVFRPHILYVGFGMPHQEDWIRGHINQIEARVFLPLGACLDFYTGHVYRGPRWMTDHGLEWLSRLLIEPGRLWQRYLVGNPLFLWRVLKQQLWQLPPRKL
ncbi:MAG: glycosyl transferase [Chloroflexota bacterium]|nr:MAG: glycosyl transferase [Chloroflexota bacterium]